MKKAIIAILVLIFIGLTVKSCMAILPKKDLKPSDYDIGMTYEKATKEDKPIITVFYADWCTYCIKFMPKLDRVRNAFKNDFNVVLMDVENPDNKPMVDDYRISGFPTLYIIDPKYDNRVHIDSAYMDNVTTLSKEISRYAKVRKLMDKGSSCK